MISSSDLFATKFPQMADDGVIDQDELDSEGGVLFEVPAYSDAAVGDYITFNFDVEKSFYLYLESEPVNQYFPWSGTVPQDLLIDGSYQAWYTVIDYIGNQAASPISTVFIDRSHQGTLPPPTFPEAIDNVINDSAAVSGGGTPVAIPAYANIAVDDNVLVYWNGFDEQNQAIPDSATTVAYTVKAADLINGFTVTITTPYITSIGEGTAQAWYTVHSGSRIPERSVNSVPVIIDTVCECLPAPVFPDGTDGWIDANEALNGTPLSVPIYSNMRVGDIVTTYWQGYTSNGVLISAAYDMQHHPVVAADLVAGFSVTLPEAALYAINVGYGQAYYSVDFTQSASTGTSLTAQVNVDTEHCTCLPAPTFPEAVHGVIDTNAATSNGGTPMAVTYSPMQIGDTVTLQWTGYHNGNLTPVPGAVFSLTVEVNEANIRANHIVIVIPTQFILAIGDGYAVGNYQVAYRAGGIGYSEDGDVVISQKTQPSIKVMGARTSMHASGQSQVGRLCAFDALTGTPMSAYWYYEGESPATATHSFIDTQPSCPLVVCNASCNTDLITLNPSNITGNGGWSDDETTSGSFIALLNDKSVLGWGNPQYGGSTPPSCYNQSVYALYATFKAFAFLHNSGSVYAWGDSQEGGAVPSNILSRSDWLELAAAEGTFACRGSHSPYIQVWGWGLDGDSPFNLNVPSNIACMSDLVSLHAGDNAFATVSAAGRVYAWGDKTAGGSVPSNISCLSNITSCCSSRRAFSVIYGCGKIAAWGDSDYGSNASSVSWVQNASRLVATESAFTALLSNGGMACWGYNEFGGTMPSQYASRTDIVDVKATYGAFAALCADGSVLTWGSSEYGGNSKSVSSALVNIVSIAANATSFAALKEDGSLVVWGNSLYGGSTCNATGTLEDVLAVYGNTHAFIALKADGSVVAWGENASGVSTLPTMLDGNISYLKK